MLPASIFPWRSFEILAWKSPISDFGLKIGHFSRKNVVFLERSPGASISEMGYFYSHERKMWLQRKNSFKIIWFIFGMHPKGTQITKFTACHKLTFSKSSKSWQNLMNARGKPDISFEKCVYFHPFYFYDCAVWIRRVFFSWKSHAIYMAWMWSNQGEMF